MMQHFVHILKVKWRKRLFCSDLNRRLPTRLRLFALLLLRSSLRSSLGSLGLSLNSRSLRRDLLSGDLFAHGGDLLNLDNKTVS